MDSFDVQQPVEVVPGLILGSLRALNAILDCKPDVLFPLDRLPGTVWDRGYRGDVAYYPITDAGVLPDEVLERLVREILKCLAEGKRAALFCAGGHGRTGYVAACVLFQLGETRPIVFLREKYSPSAVETDEQVRAVQRFCWDHIARTYWHCLRMVHHVTVRSRKALLADPQVQQELNRVSKALGPNTRFAVFFADEQSRDLKLVAETRDEALCRETIRAFSAFLRERGHLEEEP